MHTLYLAAYPWVDNLKTGLKQSAVLIKYLYATGYQLARLFTYNVRYNYNISIP